MGAMGFYHTHDVFSMGSQCHGRLHEVFLIRLRTHRCEPNRSTQHPNPILLSADNYLQHPVKTHPNPDTQKMGGKQGCASKNPCASKGMKHNKSSGM